MTFKERRKQTNRKYYESIREMVNEYKRQPCIDCKKIYPIYMMQFDHLDPKRKVAAVCSLISRKGKKAILAEIQKCEVVCIQCHCIRTYGRKILG